MNRLLPAVIPLPVARYRLLFEPSTTLSLPPFAGSLFRGAFGHALRRICCVTGLPTCSPCPEYRACHYPYVFETPPPVDADRMRRYDQVPHPYVLMPGEGCKERIGAQERFDVHLTLVGAACELAPLVVQAMRSAAHTGLGAQRVSARLVESVAEPPASPIPPAVPRRVRLMLDTPLRMRLDNRNVTANQFSFGAFFGVLLRRVSMLCTFHGAGPLDLDFKALTAMARSVSDCGSTLQWWDWARHSSRQGRDVKMGGLLGYVDFSGADIAPFWSCLWLGQWVHAGKGTVMGLGAYRLIDLDNSTSAKGMV